MDNYDQQKASEWQVFIAELQQKETALLKKKSGGGLHVDEALQLQEIRNILFDPELEILESSISTDDGWLAIKEQIKKPEKMMRLNPFVRYFAYAASVALVIGLGWFGFQKNSDPVNVSVAVFKKDAAGKNQASLMLDDGTVMALNSTSKQKINAGNIQFSDSEREISYQNNNELSNDFHTLFVPRGGGYRLELEDKTRVWINADTKLRYATSFKGVERREVYLLSGEAYFEVTHNAKQPFIVHVNDIEVKVLGTAFNVSAYDKNVRTTLVSGKVRIRTGTGEEMNLMPNQQCYYNADMQGLSKSNVNVMPFAAWKDGLFIFNEASLAEIMTVMSRWYDYDVVFTSDALKSLHFTGNLEKYDNINDFLEMIQETTNVKFYVKNKIVTVTKK